MSLPVIPQKSKKVQKLPRLSPPRTFIRGSFLNPIKTVSKTNKQTNKQPNHKNNKTKHYILYNILYIIYWTNCLIYLSEVLGRLGTALLTIMCDMAAVLDLLQTNSETVPSLTSANFIWYPLCLHLTPFSPSEIAWKPYCCFACNSPTNWTSVVLNHSLS